MILTPRLPSGPAVDEDRKTPRISVVGEVAAVDSVSACLRGITTIKLPKTAYIYRLHGRPRGLDTDTPYRSIPDWEETGEAWLLAPNEFRRVGTIEIEAGILSVPEIRWRLLPGGAWNTAKDA